MSPSMPRQRGEGKVGCIVSMFILIILGAVTWKLLPIYFNNNQLADFAEDMCLRASNVPAAVIEKQVKVKANELGIHEAQQAGAIKVTKTGEMSGMCTVRLEYTIKVDMYGIRTFNWQTSKSISKPFGIPDT